jgi:hypothetical protein
MGMTVAEAAEAVFHEANREVRELQPGTADYERARLATLDSQRQLSNSPIFKELCSQLDEGATPVIIVLVALRAGMRIQRKLERPEQTTTLFDTPTTSTAEAPARWTQ